MATAGIAPTDHAIERDAAGFPVAKTPLFLPDPSTSYRPVGARREHEAGLIPDIT